MEQNAMGRWIAPQFILVATNLVENHTFMLHAIYQAKLSGAKVLLVHVIPPSHRSSEAVCVAPFVQPSLVVQPGRAKLEELATEFRREGIECEPIVVKGPPEEQIPLIVKSRTVDRIIVAARNAAGVERLIGGSCRGGIDIRCRNSSVHRRSPHTPRLSVYLSA